MKNGVNALVAAVLLAMAAGCGEGGDLGGSDSYSFDGATDTTGIHDVLPEPTSDAASDATWWPDAVSDPAPDAVPEDAVEEAVPPPEDVCDAEITEPQVLYLSADDSNSMASPIIARSLINSGFIVPARSVRTYEYTNYYDIGYAPAEHGRVNVEIHMKPESALVDEVMHNMQIGVQSHALAAGERRSVNITFIMDTSGSMSGRPIELERYVCETVAGSLRDGDIVSMVVWAESDAVVLDSRLVAGPDDPLLISACRGLSPGGGTNLSGGLDAGYELARLNFHPSYLNRVILVSDGQANIGVTDENVIAMAAEDSEGEGIYLVGVGVGDGYNDSLMDAVTDAGKGAYVFIDSTAEAYRMFSQRFLSTLEIAVMDVQVELTLPTWLRIEEFHGEEISTDPKEVEPQHLAPNDAMIFHQLLKACTDLVLDDTIRAVARYTDPVTRVRTSDERTVTIADLLASQGDVQLVKGTAIVEYAEGLKEISDLMQAHETAEARSTCILVRESVSAAAVATLDPDLDEIVELLDAYCGSLETRRITSWY